MDYIVSIMEPDTCILGHCAKLKELRYVCKVEHNADLQICVCIYIHSVEFCWFLVLWCLPLYDSSNKKD